MSFVICNKFTSIATKWRVPASLPPFCHVTPLLCYDAWYISMLTIKIISKMYFKLIKRDWGEAILTYKTPGPGCLMEGRFIQIATEKAIQRIRNSRKTVSTLPFRPNESMSKDTEYPQKFGSLGMNSFMGISRWNISLLIKICSFYVPYFYLVIFIINKHMTEKKYLWHLWAIIPWHDVNYYIIITFWTF